MKFKDSTDDFIMGRSPYSIGDKLYNFLRDAKTQITTPTILVFANGEISQAIHLDENGNRINPSSLEIVQSIFTENPSEYLMENQELANSVSHVLIEVPLNEA